MNETISFIGPLLLSLRVSLLATMVVIPTGIFLGWLLGRYQFRGRTLIEGLLMLPLVLPPTVIGFFLIMLLGRSGPLGKIWEALTGRGIAFTWLGAAIAAGVVSLPIMVRASTAAIRAVEPRFEEASYSLGKGRLETFMRVPLPLARRGLLAGAVLAFARALGEFGATLMLAGNLPGRTQTMPLPIYQAMISGEDARATSFALLLALISIIVVILAARLEPSRW